MASIGCRARSGSAGAVSRTRWCASPKWWVALSGLVLLEGSRSLHQQKCCLCPSREGAFKRTTGPDEFCHVECALWNPEVHFADPVRLEPVVLSAELRKQLGSTLCSICHELNKPSRELASFGFTIPCAVSGCEKRMHVSWLAATLSPVPTLDVLLSRRSLTLTRLSLRLQRPKAELVETPFKRGPVGSSSPDWIPGMLPAASERHEQSGG